MPLHPQAAAYIQAAIDEGVPAVDTMTPEAARAMRRDRLRQQNPPLDPDIAMADCAIPGPAGDIPIRIYTPPGTAPYSALVYFHGGGFVLGDLEAYDHVCVLLAGAAGCKVISVEYRLAPEHPFPAGVDDAYAALQWILANPAEFDIDGARIAGCGDSAGATLLTVACLLAVERGGRLPRCQVLIYPVAAPPGETESQESFATGYSLTMRAMNWYYTHYAGSPDAGRNPLVFPLVSEDLHGLPPALVVTAEYDPLRDEGEAYAERLRAAGVEVTCTRYPGMIHGFLSALPAMDTRTDLVHEIAEYVQAAFRTA